MSEDGDTETVYNTSGCSEEHGLSPRLSQRLLKNGAEQREAGSDSRSRGAGRLCLMVSVGLVPRPETWCPLCSLKPSSSADRRPHKDTVKAPSKRRNWDSHSLWRGFEDGQENIFKWIYQNHLYCINSCFLYPLYLNTLYLHQEWVLSTKHDNGMLPIQLQSATSPLDVTKSHTLHL